LYLETQNLGRGPQVIRIALGDAAIEAFQRCTAVRPQCGLGMLKEGVDIGRELRRQVVVSLGQDRAFD
jgi:hypothetical protein